MKILLVTWHFPPVNNIAAIRVGKMASFFHRQGHDIRVITAAKDDPDRSLELQMPEELVTATEWFDIDKFAHPITALKSAWARQAPADAAGDTAAARDDAGGTPSRLRRRVASFYNSLFFFPDRYIGWVPRLTAAGDSLLRHWRPDLIIGTGPPFTVLIGAQRLAARHGIPWFAEFRDRWTDDPYFPPPRWREGLEKKLERRLIASARGIVTVSPPWAEFYERKFGKPTALVYNGFDPDDFPAEPLDSGPGPVRILHAGTIYPGHRDPTPLFQAIVKSGLGPDEIKVVFFGRSVQGVHGLAEASGAGAFVETHGAVPYAESIEMQRRADVLLLLQWNDPKEQGNVPAKLFEYLAVCRPILGIGLVGGVPSRLIGERRAGLFCNDPDQIAKQLRDWVDAKKRGQTIKALPITVRDGFSRGDQYSQLESFLTDNLDSNQEGAAAKGARARPGRAERAAPVTIRASRLYQPADEAALAKPVMCLIIDAEEDFDWNAPFSSQNRSIDSIEHQYQAQEIFDRYGVRPTYLVDHPVASNPVSVRILREILDDGRCEVGTQLHPWVNPPLREDVTDRNSFISNLPLDLYEQKLATLTDTIEDNFKMRPTVYKAGRYGFDLRGAKLIEKFGYVVDTSVVPHTSFAAEGGPDFTAWPAEPCWFGEERRLLELPLTRGLVGSLGRPLGKSLSSLIDDQVLGAFRIPGILSRSHLAERITLTPEGVNHQAHRRLASNLLREGRKIFCFSYHSSSLAPGNTPYVQNQDDLRELLYRIEAFLDYFLNQIGGIAMTPMELYRELSEKQ